MGEIRVDSSRITELLKNNPDGMSLREIAEAIDMNRVTAARHLDVLVASGRVEMTPFGQAKVFYPSRRVPVFSLIDCISDIVLVIDDTMKIRQLNRAFLQLFGGVPGDYHGLPVRDVLCPDDPGNNLFGLLEQALRGKGTDGEITIKKKDETIYFKLNVFPCVFENGKRSVSIVMTDISGIKRAEELNQANSEMVGRISSAVSPDEVFMAGAETALVALKADAAAVFIKREAKSFSFQCGTGDDEFFRENPACIWDKYEICERIVSGTPAFYSKSETDGDITEALSEYGFCSLYAYPLFRNGLVAGFLAVASSKKGGIFKFEITDLELISYRMSGALSLMDAEKEAVRPVPEIYLLYSCSGDDCAGKILAVNDAAVSLLGYPKEKLLEMNISEVDMMNDLQSLEAVMAGIRETDNYEIESVFKKNDGENMLVKLNLQLLEAPDSDFLLSCARPKEK